MLLGTTLLYVLTASDVGAVNRRRVSADDIRQRLKHNPPTWPTGAMAHIGDPAMEGEVLPLIVTRTTDDDGLVGGHVLLHGSDTLWLAAVEVVRDGPPQPGKAITITDYAAFEATGLGARR